MEHYLESFNSSNSFCFSSNIIYEQFYFFSHVFLLLLIFCAFYAHFLVSLKKIRKNIYQKGINRLNPKFNYQNEHSRHEFKPFILVVFEH